MLSQGLAVSDQNLESKRVKIIVFSGCYENCQEYRDTTQRGIWSIQLNIWGKSNKTKGDESSDEYLICWLKIVLNLCFKKYISHIGLNKQ